MKNEQEATSTIHLIAEIGPSEMPGSFNCTNTLTTYYCDQCKFNTHFLVDLKIHTYKHTPGLRKRPRILLYLCGQCSYKTHSLLMLFDHYVRHHRCYTKHKWFTCKRCPNWRGNFYRFTCRRCSFTTNWKCRLLKHMISVHKKFQWIKCAFCSFKTRQKSSLRRHVKALHTPVEKIQWFECEVCHHKTVRGDHMKRHMKEVHACTVYKIQHDVRVDWQLAEDAWKRSYKEASLQGHTRENHRNVKEMATLEAQVPRVFATNCPEIKDNGHNVFLCEFCTGHNVYQCVFCPVKTISRRILSRHIEEVHESNTNVEEKLAETPVMFQCDQCNFSTEWMNTLKMHKLLKHRKKDLFMNLISS